MNNTLLDNEQYLTFMLKGELFAFDVLKTREVLNLIKITPIPKTPAFMAGVINLRGSVVPVINLRNKFDMPDITSTIETSIIIVEVAYGQEIVIIGALVDEVKSVVRIAKNQTEPPPRVGMHLNMNLISALAKKDDIFVMILDVDKVFSEEELNELAQTTRKSTDLQMAVSV